MARIGIDLGTTNTLAAMVYDDGAHVIPRGRGRVIPSVAFLRWQSGPDDVVVGEEAEKWMAEGRVVRSIKRLMGRTHAEAVKQESAKYFKPSNASVRMVSRGENDLGLEVRGPGPATRTLWPHEISAWVLREARAHAERSLGRPIEAAAITVPAYFRDPHRAATLDAARLAGIEVWGDLLDEPTAAALAFAPVVGFRPGEPVLVVDWGGGTLDVTVLMSRGSQWFQAAIGGDLVLGGDDLDRALAEWAVGQAGLDRRLLDDEQNEWMLRQAARQAKELLSAREEATLACARLLDPETGKRARPIALTVTRDGMERVIAPFVERAVEIVQATLESPDVTRRDIRKVLLVGGSTRIPLFRKRLAEALPGMRFHDEVDAMEAVALGAARYAHERPEIARICPYGYAVVLDDDTHVDVIPPRTDVPTPADLPFAVPMQTRYPGQTVYRVTLAAFEEADGARRYHEPRRLFARGVPSSNVGTPVDVELSLDGNKDLSARCHVQGHAGAHPMEGREEADGELFTRLLNATLEGESLLEANTSHTKGLLPKLRQSVEWARAATETRDREQAGEVLGHLRDLADQVQDKQRALADGGLPPNVAAERRITGWIWFYEQELLPHFWEALTPDHRERAIQRLRALRVQLQTGAPADEMEMGLNAVREVVFSGDLEVPMRAWMSAGLLGVPDRLQERLRELATAARDHYLEDGAAGMEGDLPALHAALAEADQAWKTWHETSTILDARPDLVFVKRDGNARPN